jgi:hypothetical protein
LALALGRTGYDLSVASDAKTWDCLVEENSDVFAIIRAYRNVGQVDTNSANSIKAAYAAGVRDLGVYMFPCVQGSAYAISTNLTCDSAEGQVKAMVSYLQSEGIFIKGSSLQPNGEPVAVVNSIWLDIEDEVPAKWFSTDTSANQNLFADLVNAVEGLGIVAGVYSTSAYWKNILDNVEGYGSTHSLWYPRYDATDSFDFFEPFADWTLDSLKIKQTGGNVGTCGLTQVDSNYAEDENVAHHAAS